jgi:hypothetical protein
MDYIFRAPMRSAAWPPMQLSTGEILNTKGIFSKFCEKVGFRRLCLFANKNLITGETRAIRGKFVVVLLLLFVCPNQ